MTNWMTYFSCLFACLLLATGNLAAQEPVKFYDGGNLVASVEKIEPYFRVNQQDVRQGAFDYSSLAPADRNKTVRLKLLGITRADKYILKVQATTINLSPNQVSREFRFDSKSSTLSFTPTQDGTARITLLFTVAKRSLTSEELVPLGKSMKREFTYRISGLEAPQPVAESPAETSTDLLAENRPGEATESAPKPEETSQPPKNTPPKPPPRTNKPSSHKPRPTSSGTSSKPRVQEKPATTDQAPPTTEEPQKEDTEAETDLVQSPEERRNELQQENDSVKVANIPLSAQKKNLFGEDPLANPLVLGGLGALALLVLGLLVWWVSRSKKPAEKQAEEAAPPQTEEEAESKAVGRTSIKLNKRQGGEDKPQPTHFPDIVATKDDYAFELEAIWPDTAVKQVHLDKECAKELHAFIYEGNLLLRESGRDVPEIGGFLLGMKKEVGEGQYEVFLKKFVSVEPESHGVYRIEFGSKAWAKLDELKESKDFESMEIMAWFHTHPGHGLFLSQPDLNIHEGFFREPYQLAMEIDTLTDRLDMTFFSRTREGVINNSNRRKKEVAWFSWYDLIKKHKLGPLVGEPPTDKNEAKELTDADQKAT